MIPVKKVIICFLIISLVLTGCVENEEDESDIDLSSGEVQTEIGLVSLSSSEINPDRVIRVEAHVENNNYYEAEDIEVEISNLYPLSLDDGVEETCEIEELEPYSPDTDVRGDIEVCEWDFVCETDQCMFLYENYDQPYTVDFDLELTYSTEVSNPDETINLEFLPLSELREDDVEEISYLAENGDLKIKADYETPVPAEEERFTKEMSIENVGQGSLVEEEIEIDYTGTLVGHIGNRDECGTLYLPEDRESTETTCSYSVTDTLPEDVYYLSIRGNYKYQEEETIEIDIT